MASRFALYQNSIRKFIVNQSVIANHTYKNRFIELSKNSDYILPIALLTIMNNQQKKNKVSVTHGYGMATGIELINILFTLLHNYDIELVPITVSLIYTALSHTINDLFQQHVEFNKNAIHCNEQLNSKLTQIISTVLGFKPSGCILIKKTDLIKYHFVNPKCFEKLQLIKQHPKDILIAYITNTYGNMCRIALILGWLLGGSSPDMIPNLERLGFHLGMMIKLSYDFTNIEHDLNTSKDGISQNYVLNYGIQDSFDLFMESKTKFIEGTLTLTLSTPTIKEFVDLLESKIDITINNASPELHLTSSPAPDSLLLKQIK